MLSTSRLYRAIREFSVNSPVWDSRRVIFQTNPSHRWDVTLVSQEVYGNRNEFIAVMASAGLDRFDDELPEQQLVLPDADTLAKIKAAVGFDDGA